MDAGRTPYRNQRRSWLHFFKKCRCLIPRREGESQAKSENATVVQKMLSCTERLTVHKIRTSRFLLQGPRTGRAILPGERYPGLPLRSIYASQDYRGSRTRVVPDVRPGATERLLRAAAGVGRTSGESLPANGREVPARSVRVRSPRPWPEESQSVPKRHRIRLAVRH